MKITIPISELDAELLLKGNTFSWTFTADTGDKVDVLLRPEVDSDL